MCVCPLYFSGLEQRTLKSASKSLSLVITSPHVHRSTFPVDSST
jgi:hypothetical protein